MWSEDRFALHSCFFNSHADGSVKFWDASGCNLLFLYKLRTNRLFDRVQHAHSASINTGRDGNPMSKFDTKASRTNSNTADEQVQQQVNLLNICSDSNAHENPFAIYAVKMCCDGKYLIAAARGGHATLFKFTGSELEKADEGLGDLSFLEIPILHRNLINDHDEVNSSGNSSNTNEQPSRQSTDKKVSLDTALSLQREKRIVRCVGFQESTSSEDGLPSHGRLSAWTRVPSVMVAKR